MYVFTYAFLVFYFINGILSDPVGPTVQTRFGTVVGSYKHSHKGRRYAIFEGIPFAKPPVGTLRFEPPQPIEEWDKILYANKEPNMCVRRKAISDPNDNSVKGDEDCLYLNICVPSTDKSKLLPVLVMFHGGGFTRGSARIGVSFIMDRDVIYVSMSYRLGILGFLSTGNGHIPGNMGLKDQSMALKWTYDNIQSFGGDPKKITLIGCSTGAASVHFHYLSPLSRGLFQNGISFSGSALNPGRIEINSNQKFQRLADLMKCPKGNDEITIECLRNKPAAELEAVTNLFNGWPGRPRIPFGPVVEKDSPQPFIDRAPVDIIKSGDVADVLWIAGVVQDEGFSPGSQFVESDTYLEQLDKNWNEIAPHMLIYNMPVENQNHFSQLIRKNYFGNEKISKSNVYTMLSLVGHRIHCTRMRTAAKLQAKVNKNLVLFWYYSYRAHATGSESLIKSIKNPGVSHSDDINMVIDSRFIYPPNNTRDQEVQTKMLNMVVSVAEKGYPDFGKPIQWESVNSETDQLELLHFAAPDNITMEYKDNFCNYQFWDPIDAYELSVVA